MLDEAGYAYAEIPLPHTIRSKAVGAIAKAQTVPQVFINGQLIGDSDALETYLKRQQGQREPPAQSRLTKASSTPPTEPWT